MADRGMSDGRRENVYKGGGMWAPEDSQDRPQAREGAAASLGREGRERLQTAQLRRFGGDLDIFLL